MVGFYLRSSTSFPYRFSLYFSRFNAEECGLLLTVCWSLQYHRNKKIWNCIVFFPQSVFQFTERSLENWVLAQAFEFGKLFYCGSLAVSFSCILEGQHGYCNKYVQHVYRCWPNCQKSYGMLCCCQIFFFLMSSFSPKVSEAMGIMEALT